MKKNWLTIILYILFYSFIFLLLLKNSFSYLDADFGWHLKFGQDFFINRGILHQQKYMWTLPQETWVNHEWLTDVVMYFIYDHCGYAFINILFALLILISLIIATIFLKKTHKIKNDFFLILFQLLGVYGSLGSFGVRMQEISFLFLAILLILLFYIEKKFSKKIYLLIPLFLLWANLHGGFLIGLAVLFFYNFIKFINLKINVNKDNLDELRREKQKLSTMLLVSLGSILATLVNPYGLKMYVFLKDYFTNTAYFSLISEWRPVYLFPVPYLKIIFIALIFSILIIPLITKKNIKIFLKKNLWTFSTSLIFLIAAIKSVRHFPLFFIATFIILLPVFIKNNLEDIHFKKSRFDTFINIFILICFSMLPLFYFFNNNFNFNNNPFEYKKYCFDNPCGAVNFLKNNPQYTKLKLLNHYNFGGYLIWNKPDLQLFIDGRMPQYKFKDKSIMEKFAEFDNENEIKNKLEEYEIKMIIWNNKEKKYKLNWIDKYLLFIDEAKINNQKKPMLDYLKNSTDWKSVYEDKISVIYVKKN